MDRGERKTIDAKGDLAVARELTIWFAIGVGKQIGPLLIMLMF